MKKSLLFILLSLLSIPTIFARPVLSGTARNAARQFLAVNESRYGQASLTLCDSWNSSTGDTLMFVFNIDDIGFIIVTADDELPPVMGYSFNGSYRRDILPENFVGWMENCSADIQGVLSCVSLPQEIAEDQKTWHKEWIALLEHDNSFYASKGSKSVQPLIQTRWEQGAGYNNYCPEWQNGSNGHCVTGCVATAMAQIIRYHEYPNVGFYHRGYAHPAYGYLTAYFDSSYYDYTKMPVSVNRYSPADQQHAVSLLCYHCGVSVKMTYEYAQHTSGSGAYSHNVPQALMYFGYTESKYKSKIDFTNDEWTSMLRHDLDRGLPVYYSGSGTAGGHAFICDGYNNNGYFHFNFGWGGYSDNYYALTSLNGFSGDQAAVFNIVPSGLGSLLDTIYIDSEGTGDGSSWAEANPNLLSAMKLRDFYKSGKIWVKSGTYYGDTTSQTAFVIPSGLKIYGGFIGTETGINDRNDTTAPSILSGMGVRRIARTPSLTSTTILDHLTFADGYSESNAAAINIDDNLRLEYCTIRDCHTADSSLPAVSVDGGLLYSSFIYNNHCSGLTLLDGKVTNCLIAHNEIYGVNGEGGNLINCDVVSNNGIGIKNHNINIRNCIIWNNDSSLTTPNNGRIIFSAIEGMDWSDTCSNVSLLHENRPLQGIGPFFMMPDTTRGYSNILGDWHLSSLSPLVDAGDTLRSGIFTFDIEGNNRFRNGRTDMGCYEWIPGVGITPVSDASDLRVYPNPTSAILWIDGTDGIATLYDIQGRVVCRALITEGHATMDIRHLPQGLYLLRTHNQATKIIKK